MTDETSFVELRDELERKLDEVRARLERLEAERDDAYHQRDLAVALLARLAMASRWSAGVRPHEGPALDARWKRVVFIETPEGQLSWHFPEEEAHLFDALPSHPKAWDGHTSDQKNARMERAIAQIDRLQAQLPGRS